MQASGPSQVSAKEAPAVHSRGQRKGPPVGADGPIRVPIAWEGWGRDRGNGDWHQYPLNRRGGLIIRWCRSRSSASFSFGLLPICTMRRELPPWPMPEAKSREKHQRPSYWLASLKITPFRRTVSAQLIGRAQ
jgi:hypothetical protein